MKTFAIVVAPPMPHPKLIKEGEKPPLLLGVILVGFISLLSVLSAWIVKND